MKSGHIIKALSGYYYVQSEDGIYRCRGRGVFRKQNRTPLVGDYVEFEESGNKEGYILDLKARKNELNRPPIANIEQALIVVSAVEPTFSSLLLDRFLVKIESIEVRPIIIISKIDLVEEQHREQFSEIQAIYNNIGYQVELVGKDMSVEHILPIVTDKISVISGQSGVGKSALLNALNPKLRLETGEISRSLGRGRHTTRHVELVPIAGGLVADTPGFSTLEFENIEKEALGNYFPEIKARRPKCKFRECLHDKEPHCAVKEAVEQEEIESFRYDHYLRFLEEIQSRKPRY